MHDFRESNADKMHYAEIAERVRFHKQEDGVVSTVCRAFEEYGKEQEAKGKLDVAKKLIQKNILPLEDIAEAADLPLKQIQHLVEQLNVIKERV